MIGNLLETKNFLESIIDAPDSQSQYEDALRELQEIEVEISEFYTKEESNNE